MSRRRSAIGIGLLAAVAAVVVVLRSGAPEPRPATQPRATTAATTKYGLGRPAAAQKVALYDLTVFPSGVGLPKGSGSAVEGERIYAAQCAACHGARGEGRGQLAPAVAGGVGSLNTAKPQQTVGSYWPYATSVFDYTRRAMPYQTPGSLTADEVYAVTAYILFLNGIVGREDRLDEKTLAAVKMPNRDGFVPDPRPDVHRGASASR